MNIDPINSQGVPCYEESRRLYKAASEVTPGGVNSNVRMDAKPVPLFFKGGEGAYLWDVDGNRYVDYVLGMGPCILGHNHPAVTRALQATFGQGQLFAGQHEAEIRLARLLCETIPCAEMVRLSLSGSEANQAAFRIARSFTGRPKIVKFEGHYHGWFDNELISVKPALEAMGPAEAPWPVLMSRGQAPSVLEDVIVLPWNDLAAFERCLRARGPEIAGAIMEPIMCNTGVISPLPGYLEGVRELCTLYGVVLIFDEVITGFRVSLGGAQELFGVTPDVAVFAKAMGGGVPVSCLVGRRDIMSLFGEGHTTHSGTYNSNVLSVAAALATVEELRRDDGASFRQLTALGRQLMDGLRTASRQIGVPMLVQGPGPIFQTAFASGAPIVDCRSFISGTDGSLLSRFAAELQERGIRVHSRGMWFLSSAHSAADVEQTITAAREALAALRQ